MIKTLRITSIIAVVLAVIFFVFPAVFGVRGDKQIEQFLNSAGVIEEFRGAKGDKVKDSRQEISPLVKQAEAFALYLNPPPEPKPEPSVSHNEPRPVAVSPKFRLVGTSRHELHPELSLALIDEPGKGLHWVRQFSKVDHLIIEQVKDGLVVVRDGESTFEVVAERPEKRSILKANPSSGGRSTNNSPPVINAEVPMSAEEEAALMKEAEAERKKALAELDAMQAEMETAEADVKAGETDGGTKSDEITTARKRPVSDLKTMRISAREARKLGRLGRRLENVQRQPNRVEDNRAESDANLNKPDLNDVNIPR
ncbi:MAG: hypothetical protein ABSG99_04290 [Sedimentisphaerales bacterium]